jgi:hypothetical protein
MIAHSRIFQALHRERPMVSAWKVSLLVACVAMSGLIPAICIGTFHALRRRLAHGGDGDIDWAVALCDWGVRIVGAGLMADAAYLILRCAYDFLCLLARVRLELPRIQFRLAGVIWFNITCAAGMGVLIAGPDNAGLRIGIVYWGVIFSGLAYLALIHECSQPVADPSKKSDDIKKETE